MTPLVLFHTDYLSWLARFVSFDSIVDLTNDSSGVSFTCSVWSVRCMKIQTQHIVYIEDARYMQCSCYVVLASVSTKDRQATRDIKRPCRDPHTDLFNQSCIENYPRCVPWRKFCHCVFSSSFYFFFFGKLVCPFVVSCVSYVQCLEGIECVTGSAIVLKSDLIVIDLCELVISPTYFDKLHFQTDIYLNSSERCTIIRIYTNNKSS